MSDMFRDALKLRYQGQGRHEAIVSLGHSYSGKKGRHIERAVDAAFRLEMKPLDPPILDPAIYAAKLKEELLSESDLGQIVESVELELNANLPQGTEWLTIIDWLRRYKNKGILYYILLLWTQHAFDDQNMVRLAKNEVCAMLGIPMQLNYDSKMDLSTGKHAVTTFFTSLWLNANLRKMVHRQLIRHRGFAMYDVNRELHKVAVTDESAKFKHMVSLTAGFDTEGTKAENRRAKDAERKRQSRAKNPTGKRGRPKRNGEPNSRAEYMRNRRKKLKSVTE